MRVEVIPVEGVPEVGAGDDLVAVLAEAVAPLGPRDGDVLVVTQKIVSKAEGRIVPDDDRAARIAEETARVVARRGDLVIAETRHGFVCANAGVDASNIDAGSLSLLPEDPDATAERLRTGLSGTLGAGIAVVISDTFGRPWRRGVVNVAIGVAGMAPLVDLRGTQDAHGRALEATVVALADEVAATAGLVVGKASRRPAVLVRGLRLLGGTGSARELIRPPEEDLFRSSPLEAIHARRTIRAFGPGAVAPEAIEEAIRAACTAPAPHHSRPWRFTVLTSPTARRTLLAAMAEAWRADLRGDGVDEATVARRIARSDAVLGAAPVLIVPWVSSEAAHDYQDEERAWAERAMFLLSGGAAIQNLLLALSAQGVASCWISSTLFCQEETRGVLGVDDGWIALGAVACGPMPEGGAIPPRPPVDLDRFLDRR